MDSTMNVQTSMLREEEAALSPLSLRKHLRIVMWTGFILLLIKCTSVFVVVFISRAGVERLPVDYEVKIDYKDSNQTSCLYFEKYTLFENDDDIHSNILALFEEPMIDTSDLGRECVTYRPINQLSDGAAIEFNIPALSTQYLDLKRMNLHVKINITKGDETPITRFVSDAEGNTTGDTVYIANAPLHSLFSQIDLSLQQQPLSQVGPNYPYKAYLDLLFDTENDQELYSQLFVKDTGGGTGACAKERTKYLLNGKTTDLTCGLI
jgi:hypothetical protein